MLYCFNTSHITLYPIAYIWFTVLFTFQYITCYSLSIYYCKMTVLKRVSIHHMLLFIKEGLPNIYDLFLFQYITCYSLSTESAFCKSEFIQFQYITCYSLSFHSKGTSRRKKMFQYITCYSLSTGVKLNDNEGLGFNTSHVTLYRNVHS